MAILDTLHAADVEIMSPMFVSGREASAQQAVPERRLAGEKRRLEAVEKRAETLRKRRDEA
jgi:hypothetical protein